MPYTAKVKREKTYAVFALSVLKVLPLLKAFVGKTFAIHRKSTKNAKLFSSVALVVYGICHANLIKSCSLYLGKFWRDKSLVNY